MATTDKPRVLIVDDHPVYRWGLRRVFERMENFELAGEASDGVAALNAIQRDAPDIVLLDLEMPGLDGPGFLRTLTQKETRPKVVILSQFLDDTYLQELLAFGVNGCVLKTEDTTEIIRALESVADGETYFSPKVGKYLWGFLRAQASSQPYQGALSCRERKVAELIAQGMLTREIATVLSCSENTVKCHRANIMRKIGARNRVEIMTWVIRNRDLN